MRERFGAFALSLYSDKTLAVSPDTNALRGRRLL
jgi:hypothetical protein